MELYYVFSSLTFQNNEVMASTAQVRSRRHLAAAAGLDKNKNSKKWPLLVRSLSDSAKLHHLHKNPRQIKTETKAWTLSLSDSRLFSSKKSLTSLVPGDLQDTTAASAVILDILNDKDLAVETCSCGCDREGGSECLEEDCYSEDEGCFVITSVPASNEEQEEVTNKVKTHQG